MTETIPVYIKDTEVLQAESEPTNLVIKSGRCAQRRV
jgi:hypothetical protein